MSDTLKEIFLVYKYWSLWGRILIRDAGLICQINPVWHVSLGNTWTQGDFAFPALKLFISKNLLKKKWNNPTHLPTSLFAAWHRQGLCCRLVLQRKWEGRDEEEGGGEACTPICDELWLASLMVWHLFFCIPEEEKDSASCHSVRGGGLHSRKDWGCSAGQLSSGGVLQQQSSLSHYLPVLMCMCVWNVCLSMFIVPSLPLSELLSWFYTTCVLSEHLSIRSGFLFCYEPFIAT